MENKLTRKERERHARRELIIDVAEQILQEQGFESVTMEEIAERAELGKGTLYLHFKSKLSIFLAVCLRGSKKLHGQMSKVLTANISGLEMVEKMGYTYLSFIKHNPLYFNAFSFYESQVNLEIIQENPLAEKCEKNAKEALTLIIRAIQIGMQDGSIRSDLDPQQLSLMIWGGSKGVVHMSFMKEQNRHPSVLADVQFDLESIMDGYIQLIKKGLTTHDYQSKKA